MQSLLSVVENRTGWGSPTLKVERFDKGGLDDTIIYTETEGQKATLAFPGFDLVDLYRGQRFRFPPGHVSVIVDGEEHELTSPFIEEAYTHPYLLHEDEKHQYLSLNESLCPKQASLHSRVEWILRTSARGMSVSLVLMRSPGFYPVHSLDSPMFKRYRIDPHTL